MLLSLDTAIKIVNGRLQQDKLSEAEIFFAKRLNELSENAFEERGETYYYILRCKLQRNTLYETQDIVHLYQEMIKYFWEAGKVYWKNYQQSKNHLLLAHLKAFYHLASHYTGSIEGAYLHRHFDDSARAAHKDKMRFRKKSYWLEKQYLKWLGYNIIEITTDYGTSFIRWGLTSITVIFIFAAIYFLLDRFTSANQQMYQQMVNIIDYIYYSAVTFATLGYGDILPVTIPQKITAIIEALSGYVMLGGLIDLLNRKQ